jgi:N-methylhydantoinase A/oxoprolinase/acetone carboxylase beta subunit/N-methylhydantoinase B/oxoprolinase/acetone carboxylase alpha subunit
LQILGVDTGGTFTDLASYDSVKKRLVYSKSLTTYDDLTKGIFGCIDKAGVGCGGGGVFKHGTTLAINALLQRSASGIALVTTRGFRDVLELARGNRPDTFDLFFRRDPPLVPRDLRFEITERVDGKGQSTTPPDRAEVELLADRLQRMGIQAVAVAFMNSYLAPAHELLVAGWLRERLAEVFVTCSTDLSREWYEYERTATVAANAYVGPQMNGYINRLEAKLRERDFTGRLFMMGSNGGALSVARALREPIALVESGPVGGCIGAAAYAEALGLSQVLAFDMGGTTAKCALLENGHFDVKSVYHVGGYGKGFPVRGAVIDIVEVSAGGGSIAWLDESRRLNVGPRSAGSSPGPACYASGGIEPTVTDANAVLGRLAPENFLGGELKLDVGAAEVAIRDRIALPLGFDGADGVLRTAAGMLLIATVIMAGSIKRVSVERGRDPRDFVLFAYGGGGPLHAVELARELHIPLVVIPPEPGNFSAIGMLLADLRRDRAETLLCPLSATAVAQMDEMFRQLETDLGNELRAEAGNSDIRFMREVELRYRGQVHSLPTPCRDVLNVAELQDSFEQLYLKRFGHVETNNPLEIVGLRVAGFARVAKPDLQALWTSPDGPPREDRVCDVYFVDAQGRLPTRVFRRHELPAGFACPGPALIEEYGSTTLVGPHDRFDIGRMGEIRIHVGREQGARMMNDMAAAPVRCDIDPITLEVIRHGLQSIPDEIESDITRTAYSPLVYEYKDYAIGLLDAEGRLIAMSRGGIPLFLANVFALAVADGLAIYGREAIARGDAIISNHASTFGQHLNNVSMYMPVFAGDGGRQLVGFVAVLVHWIDVGGRYVGSSASNDTTDIFQEGIQFRTVKLRSRGEPVAEIYRMIEYNTRFPEMLLGDVAAQLSACIKGCQLLEEIFVRHGLATVQSAIQTIWQQSADRATAAVRAIPDGVYQARSFLDDDGVDLGKPVNIAVTVRVDGDRFTIDFSDIAGQLRGPFNAGHFGGGVTTARLAFKYLTTPDEPTNEGSFKPLNVILPPGKFLSAGPNAPLARYSTPLPTVIDTIIWAMQDAVPERVAAGHHGQAGSHRFHGILGDGRLFSHLDTAHGGWGASAHRDGTGPFKTLAHGDTRDVPVESQEALYPLRIDLIRFLPDSGGAGKFRGGLGLEKIYTILGPCKLTVTFIRHECPAWGLRGGQSGAVAYVEITRVGQPTKRLWKVSDTPLDLGDQVIICTGGGGGYGSPLDREPQLVLDDLRCGYITQPAAGEIYGIVRGADEMLDEPATVALRESLRREKASA